MAKPYGLPKRALLCSKKEITKIFERGCYHALGVLHAKALPTEATETRFLVSVRKSIGNAPQRNRIRRLVKEAMRQHRHRLSAPHDICFFLTRRPKSLSLNDVEQEVLSLFGRLSADENTKGRNP